MRNPEEIDDDVVIVVNRRRGQEYHAETSRLLKEHFALRDSLRAQGYSEEEVQARLNARFAHELEGIEQMTPTEYLRRVDALCAKGYSYRKACEILETAPPKKAQFPKPPATPSARRRSSAAVAVAL